MKIKSLLFAIACLGLLTAPARAQSRQPIPELINQGLNAYTQVGLDAALDVWLRNSLLNRNILSKNELLALRQAEASYGLFEGAEVLRVASLTPRVTRVYLVIYYERSPLWAFFDLYQTRNGTQTISDLLFSTKVNVILPAEWLAR